MATTVKIRRSGTATATPSSLEHGEIAINYADGKVFWKDASNVITSFTFQSYALASHTHAASDITSGTLDAARLPLATTGAAGAMIVGTGLGVSSGTVSVTYGTTSGTACEGNDARLSDARTPTSHTHGSISNDGAIGFDADQFVVTTTDGVLTAVNAATARTTLGVQPTASPTFTGTFACGDTVNIGTASAGNTIVNLGVGATGDRFAITDYIGDTTYTDFGLRVGRSNGGANGNSIIQHRGTGVLAVTAIDAGSMVFATSNTTRLTISSTGTATFAGQILADDIDTAGSVAYGFDGDTNTGVGRAGADILTLVTGGSERVRVDASGNVGIGVTPSTWGSNVNQVLELKNGVVIASNTAVAAGYFVTNITSSDGFGTSIYKITAHGHAYLQNAGDHIFYTAPSGTAGSTATLTERFKISSNNGKITAAGVYDNTVGGTNRDVYVDDGGIIGYVSSIRESKTDIVTLDDVSWLSALSPVSYRYRKQDSDGNYTDEADGVTDYGLIAEDVEAVKPELCFYDMVDGEPQLRGVTYSKLITPMLRYIQQLEARIAALEERLNHA